MQNVITTWKNMGETPLGCLERVRLEHKIESDVPMTYAGRLDPMAEGVLLLLVGEECKNKEKYLGLDKEYEVEVLLGVKTDSQDVLGLIEEVKTGGVREIDLQKYVGKFTQEYPKYSSKRIAKDFEEVEPKEVEIYSIEKLGESEVSGKEIAENSIGRIKLVKGNFRQNEIIKGWEEFNQKFGGTTFKIIRIRASCSSGTYMRNLAEKMGGLAYSIKRTKLL